MIITTADAPAAIGPYVQGVNLGAMTITSGQLPINPLDGTMPGDIAEQARQSLEDSGICPVFQTAIGYNPKVPESTLEEMPLCAFAPRSWAAIQYKKLTAEYLALTDSGKGKEG